MQTAGKRILGLALASALSMAVGHAQTAPALAGFDAAGASAQLELEGRFDKAIQPGNLKPWLERFAARPHHVGSPYDKANADYIAELFTSWGFDTRIERFDVLFPTPRTRVLELTAPTRYTARLAEPAIAEDPTSNQAAEQLPIYNAYSVNGDVTGRGTQIGVRVEAGVRLSGRGAVMELYVGYENRVDAYPLDRTSQVWGLTGLRLVSR